MALQPSFSRLLLLKLFRFGFICSLIQLSDSDPGSFSKECPRNKSTLHNFTSQFTMVQHQLRGVLTVLDDCSFKVSSFDMLPGSDVKWWGAIGLDFDNLTNGFVVSDQKLNQTLYKNDSFVVHLMDNVTWDLMETISVWDVPTASNFGYVILRSNVTDGEEHMLPPPMAENTTLNSSYNASLGLRKPTMFENCKVLSDKYRVRWTLREEDDVIDIGLEAEIGIQEYMAFGWANPNASEQFMLGSDVVITGFKESGMPFAEDYFITKYSECIKNSDGSVSGVCPDRLYGGSDSSSSANNSRLVYGHRKDGISFIRFRRWLTAVDNKFDTPVDANESMSVIWATGLIKPPDSIRPFYLPQFHGNTYGHLTLNVSERIDECLGPLDAEDKEDQDLVIADKKEALIISAGPALHYPNPPNPSKVLYINKKEAPVLRVERGVPVKFSIQAGHDVALYVTSDTLGGNATLRNTSETIYFGGPEAEGVPASPTELEWVPDRNTPDLVYYHSLYTPKMGWKVQVVDGGLPDMYNNSVLLDDQQVTFFWTLSKDTISIAARGEKKSGYLAIGFGREMLNSYAYVGWFDESGKGRVSTYWIDGRDASSIHPTHENLTYVRCKSENGIITLEFTRPLNPSCKRDEKPECNNIIDPTTPLKIIWAMGAKWSEDHLSESNMHSVTSSRPIRVMLIHGSSEAEEDLRPVLAVHGFMMFLSWGLLLPGGILSARYLKHVKGDKWFQLHVYLQYSGLAIIFLGFLFAVAELQGFLFSSLHVKFGYLAILLGVTQPVNAYFRPKKSASGEEMSSKRLLWEYTHIIVGRCSIIVGVAALITGMKHLGEKYDSKDVHGLTYALISWIVFGIFTVIYLEYRERKRRREIVFAKSSWVLGDGEDEDIDLLSPSRMASQMASHSSERMEVQLEPVSR
ncbi:hypothetical protein LIER_38480 [Lithospermum erythrorhizon]|uniref:Uncharacterized protein n=1 Tax=Lithospermum erythrorhizon TaxID=34254 RepID=A0AAV3Q0V9_LITER